MSVKQLSLAGALLVLALTPSVTDAVVIHEDHPQHVKLFWGWLALAALVLLIAGKELAG